MGQPFPFPGGVDSALNGQGRYSGKAYFFKRDKYARYDWKQDRFDLVDQKLSAWNLRSEEFGSDITGCVEGDEGGLGSSPTAYFFKGDDYVKYDWDKDRGFDGYPFPIAVGWPTGCGVWASHSQAPTNVCPDPRLDGGRPRLAYPSGTIGGQSGWQVLVESRNVKELADKLSTLIIPDFYGDDQAGKGFVPRGRVTRLGMNAHGLAGAFAANGPNAKEDFSQHLTDMRILQQEDLRADFKRIQLMLAPGAPVLLVGCKAGQTAAGGYLLMSLSNLLRGHPVTAFTTVGYAGGQGSKRHNEPCSEAGKRDTDFFHNSSSMQEENRRVADNWGDLNKWPWASDTSPRAKTALNGDIIRRPEFDIP